MFKTFEEINEKIKRGEAVVLTAEEVSKMGKEYSPQEIFDRVDVVTTGTFSPMCSSGAIINFGHASPPIRMEKISLNGVEGYGGLAAVDTYIGAAAESKDKAGYGGAHVIEELIAGNDIHLVADSRGTDCYPRKHVDTYINKDDVNEFYLFNPRNAYQNYGVAVNGSNNMIYTYMGKLLPNFSNAMYATAGELSPLLNDPEMRTIGIGTRIFLGGTEGYIVWNGTQFRTNVEKNEHGIPTIPSRTVAVVGNAKKMNTSFLKAAYIKGYGVSIYVGIGIAIPLIDIDMARRVLIKNEEIETTIFDYASEEHIPIGRTNYSILQSGFLEIKGKKVKTGTLSSLYKSRQIAETLKRWIAKGKFLLTRAVKPLPQEAILNDLKIRNRKIKNILAKECINCGSCVGICPTNALFFSEKGKVEFNRDLCVKCGKCLDVCPFGIVKMEEEGNVH